MTLILADTFEDALTRLTAAEQKQAKLAAFDLQLDPTSPGLATHPIKRAPGYWSARVSQDIRLVLHRQGERVLLAWVGHHDAAYAWAERRRLVPHERTGAMQFVQVVPHLDEPDGLRKNPSVGSADTSPTSWGGAGGKAPPHLDGEVARSAGGASGTTAASSAAPLRPASRDTSPTSWGGAGGETPPHLDGEVARSAGGAFGTTAASSAAPLRPASRATSPTSWGGAGEETFPHLDGEVARSAGGVYPFAALTDDQLLDVGVPRDWLDTVRAAEQASVDPLFARLPAEAAEALLDFATGGKLEHHIVRPAPGTDPFAHPDAQRRFRILDNLEELRAALDQPFERWAVFLHPAQRALVERAQTGPARVSGSAGTGKTIVALHRAVHLARADAGARVLLATFSKPLAAALSRKLAVLVGSDADLRDRIAVRTLDGAAVELYAAAFGQPNRATPAQVRAAIVDARKAGLGGAHSPEFLFEEWDELVDAWNVTDAESYATLPRLGRRTRLGAQGREAAWSVFAFVRRRLVDRGVVTWAQIYARLGEGASLPYTHVVVDEAQDLSVAQVRFLAAVGKGRGDALFLAGDIGQRIFHLPFSWARLGLDIRGRSHCLKVNYRTSHQIRAAADRLLPSAITDMDGVEEGRRGTVSVFDGPAPEILVAADEAAERAGVAAFLRRCAEAGIAPGEIGVLVRGQGQLARARAAVAAAGHDPRDEAGVAIVTMHDAKGLEFRAAVVMACDDDVLPDPARLAAIGDPADLEAAYETERHLLYVAATRARDRLMVSGVAPGSEFLDDLAP